MNSWNPIKHPLRGSLIMITTNSSNGDTDDYGKGEDNEKNETGSRSPCMRPRSDPPKMKNSTPDKIVAEKKITKRIGW